MRGSMPIAKIAGITIEVHYSWLIIFALLTVSLSTGWFPQLVSRQSLLAYWLAGAFASLLLFASVLVHELAHSIVARARGLPVRNITLFALGGVSNIEREPQSAGVEFWMALVGPLTSLAIGIVVWLSALTVFAHYGLLTALFAYLGVANLIVGGFNLLPAFPLDGGRVLRAAIWRVSGNLHTATRWAMRVGLVIAAFFVTIGILLLLTGDVWTGIWLLVLSWFILQSSQAERTEVALQSVLGGAVVADIMGPPPPTLPAAMMVQQAVDEYFVRLGVTVAPVEQGEHFIGLISVEDISHVPIHERHLIPIAQVMVPLGRLQTAQPQDSALEAIERMVSAGASVLPVVRDGTLVGVLDRERIAHVLSMRRVLGIGGAGGEFHHGSMHGSRDTIQP